MCIIQVAKDEVTNSFKYNSSQQSNQSIDAITANIFIFLGKQYY